MKINKMVVALAAAAGLVGAAVANDTADNCKAYVAENGGDASGCDCLGVKAESDSTLRDALAAIRTPADLEAASDATKAAIQACFPSSDNPAIQN